MAWEKAQWACGHEGSIQLYGPRSQRESKLAYEAGRKCLACWLLETWERSKDPRNDRPDKLELAHAIASGKGIRF